MVYICMHHALNRSLSTVSICQIMSDIKTISFEKRNARSFRFHHQDHDSPVNGDNHPNLGPQGLAGGAGRVGLRSFERLNTYSLLVDIRVL